MSKIPVRMKRALFRKLSGISRMLLKRRIRITEIPRNEGQIGYTSEDNVIHLSVDNPFIDELPMGEKLKFVKGIWVHETMHQILTDFNAMKILFSDDIIRSMMYKDIFNIVEDARIENFAPKHIGGIYTEDRYDKSGRITQMSDLTFAKREMYKQSPGIDTPDAFGDYPSPLQQVLRAMVHYGDCGLIKGKFRSEEANELFGKILPIYNECVEEKSCKTVIKKSIEIAEILRPLWENNMVVVTVVTDELNSLKGGDHSMEGNVIVVGISSSDSDEDNISSVNRRATTRKLTSAAQSSSETDETEPSTPEENKEDGKSEVKSDSTESDSAESPTKSSSESSECSECAENDDSKIAESAAEDDSPTHNDDAGEDGSSICCKDEAEDADKNDDSHESTESTVESSEILPDDDYETPSDSTDSGGADTEDDTEQEDIDAVENDPGTENTPEDVSSDPSMDETGKNESDSDSPENESGNDGSSPKASDNINYSDHDPEPSFSEEYDPLNNSCETDYEGHEVELDDIEDYYVPEEELDSIVDELEELIHRTEKEKVQLEDGSTPENLDFRCGEFQNVTVMNKNVKVVSDEAEETNVCDEETEIEVYSSYDIYDEVVSAMNPYIKTGIKAFQRLFRSDPDEKCHRTSGKLNIERRYSGKVTCRLFDKNTIRHKASDFAVFLLIDESGSMSWDGRYKYARLAAVGLAEMFEKLGIPLYVMGFTADERICSTEYDVIHHHYLKWNNNKKTRLSLLAISDYWNNFDGYSIRYAYNVLKKRKEPNKIMIVISDGQPSCNRCSGGVGIADARAAVNEARRNSTLLGVCIGGDYNADSLRMIYGNGLLTVNDLSELFMNISSKLRKIVKQEI
ncbi:MAG: VWA domain-containing protein [Ruminococcus sp.]|nr:VWA domain-containing protein [Ruminococcus sp.]